ncbi:MAG: OsmC family protein, partial [Flavobacteriales bacterium]|nr:OsmC family protein [Flavobacteriales bacterium]
GGQDAGPGPHELLCTALATCTAITLRMYADRKGWAMRSIGVATRMERSQHGAVVDTRLHVELDLDGDLDDDQRQRLHQIARACPVHRTLLNPIQIEIH